MEGLELPRSLPVPCQIRGVGVGFRWAAQHCVRKLQGSKVGLSPRPPCPAAARSCSWERWVGWEGEPREHRSPQAQPLLSPFLFQRARQLDEELNRRGSPVPKKVGELSPRDCMFGKAGASLLAVPCCL